MKYMLGYKRGVSEKNTYEMLQKGGYACPPCVSQGFIRAPPNHYLRSLSFKESLIGIDSSRSGKSITASSHRSF